MVPKTFLMGIFAIDQTITTPCHRRLTLLLLGILSSALLSACEKPATEKPATPNAQPPNPVELTVQTQASLQQKLDELLRDRIPATGPGAAILVTYNNQILYAQGHGLSDVEQQTPITLETVFDLASVSKSMTALAVLLLQESGDLNLADPVTQHLPDFKDPNSDHPIRISHLLNHTSGLPDYLSEWDWENNADAFPEFGIEAHLDWLNQQESQEKPGTTFRYSDTGYALLALMVQRVSEQPFPEFMAQRIFEPAAMAQTQVYQTLGETFPNQAQGYKVEEGNLESVSYPVLMWGDGNVFTSIADLARYDQALRQGKLVSAETLDAAFQNGSFDDGRPIGTKQDEGYGAGWSLTEDYGHHRGGWAGMSSYYRFYMQRPLSIVVLSNNENLDGQELGAAIAQAVIRSLR